MLTHLEAKQKVIDDINAWKDGLIMGIIEETFMAESKKKASKKPSKPKKAGFVPKIKSTRKNGLGTY